MSSSNRTTLAGEELLSRCVRSGVSYDPGTGWLFFDAASGETNNVTIDGRTITD